MSLTLTSYGAAETVTGSKHLLSCDDFHMLIDCGLFQGLEAKDFSTAEKLWDQNLPDPKELDAVILTHGHLDHCGLLPYIVRRGFNGPIYCSEATAAIAEIVLRDAAGLIQEEAKKKNKKITKESLKKKPLYQTIHVEETLRRFKTISFETRFSIGPFEGELLYAGHILGASSVSLTYKTGKRILFSGDLGRQHDPLLRAPTTKSGHDTIICESTYGDREHPEGDVDQMRLKELKELLTFAHKNDSRLLIAAFSVQRTQMLMYYMAHLIEKNPKLKMPIVFDSPMGQRVSEVFKHFPEQLKISRSAFGELYQNLTVIENHWERDSVAKIKGASVIVSSSGMMNGGRIVDYFKEIALESEATLFLPGYLGENTLGRELTQTRDVQIGEEEFTVKCRIIQSHLFSAHADHSELISWIKSCGHEDFSQTKVFLVHGQKAAEESMLASLGQENHDNCVISSYAESYILDGV